MRRVCVFCGSGPGRSPAYTEAAETLGGILAERDLGLVYGGAGVGLMGTLARSALAKGGDVIGVIPEALVDKEIALTDLSDLRVVAGMHERKMLMAELADGFVALPGGLGTIEEFFEVLTWAQLGLHDKPCGLLNIGNYFDALLTFLAHAVEERFVVAEHAAIVQVQNNPAALLDAMSAYRPQQVDKSRWARAEQARQTHQ